MTVKRFSYFPFIFDLLRFSYFVYGFSVKFSVGIFSQLSRERLGGKVQYMCLHLELCSLPTGTSMGLPSRGHIVKLI